MQVVLDHIFLDAFRKARNELDTDSEDFESWLALKKFFIKGNHTALLAEENVPVYPEELQVLLKDTNAPLPFAKSTDASTFKLNPASEEYSDLMNANPYLLYFVSFQNALSKSKGILSADLSNYLKIWNRLSLKKFPKQITVSKSGEKENKFESWNSIENYSYKCNQIILVDAYLTGYRDGGVELNTVELIKLYLNTFGEEEKHVSIITTHNANKIDKLEKLLITIRENLNDEKIRLQITSFLDKEDTSRKYTNIETKKRELKYYDYPLVKYNNPMHARYFFTNYFSIKGEYGFELLSKSKRGDLRTIKNTELDFYPFVIDKNENEAYYQNAKTRLRTYLQMINECNLTFKKEILFYGDDFVNPLFTN